MIYVLLFYLISCCELINCSVRYCDRTFNLLNRTDESYSNCKWLDDFSVSNLEACETGGKNGYLCLDQCVPVDEWCSRGTEQVWSCGSHLDNYDICRNDEYWKESKNCWKIDATILNLSEKFVCINDVPSYISNQNLTLESYCINGKDGTLDTIGPGQFTCTDKYGTRLAVCATRCNNNLDGCLHDADEVDCVQGDNTLLVIGCVILMVMSTILISELMIQRRVTKYAPLKDIEMELCEQINKEEDENISRSIAHLLDIILLEENWSQGSMDTSFFLKPVWNRGEIVSNRYAEVREMYINIRNSSIKYAVPLLLDAILLQENATLKYDCCHLIYYDLEDYYIQGTSTPTVDHSFKEKLSDFVATDFYGIVYPFFDPVSWINRNILHPIMKQLIKIIPRQLYPLKKIVIAIAIFTFHLDFMKDILIANHVTNIYKLDSKGSDFIDFIIIILWMTTFVAGVTFGVSMIASLGQQIYGEDSKKMNIWEKALMLTFLIIFCPFTITIVIYLDAKTMDKIKQNRNKFKFALQSKINRTDQVEELFKVETEYYKLVKKKMCYKNLCSRFYRLETALESTPQVMVKTLIILLAVNNPSLPWTSGLEAVFATHDPRNLAFTILFYISTAWSFVTIVNGLLKTFLYWKSYSVSDLGKILVFIRYLIGVSMKILALLFMIAPTLGILGFLNYYHIDSNFKYDPKIWPHYESIIEKTEHYEWFTLLPRLWHVCFFFACVVIVHIIIVSLMIYRYIKTRQVKRMNWLEVIQHGCITLLLPMIYEDWDCRPVQDYLTNWYSVRKEFILLSVLHLLENILLIIPSLFASIRNIERYNAMLYTLPEELKIYQVSIFILCVPLIFILFCLIESYLFIVYNKYGHPWARLLRPNFTLRPK